MSHESEIRLINDILHNDFEGTCDNCGVCCTELSINSAMPDGSTFNKPAGVTCAFLIRDNLCGVWGDTTRQPEVCRSIRPTNSLCRFDLRGKVFGELRHRQYLRLLEKHTKP